MKYQLVPLRDHQIVAFNLTRDGTFESDLQDNEYILTCPDIDRKVVGRFLVEYYDGIFYPQLDSLSAVPDGFWEQHLYLFNYPRRIRHVN